MPALTATREERLYAALANCLEAIESDPEIDRGELTARHPEFADEVSGFLSGRDQFVRLTKPLRPIEPAAMIPRSFGDYELLSEIGRGGMAMVFEARQTSLNRVVALKMVDLPTASSARRFRLEAELVATLDHTHIVPIYEVGEYEGRPFFTMKRFARSLSRARIDGDWPIGNTATQQRAAETVAAVARAVQYAHAHGVLHRDLKPGNILLDGEGRPHVADFGVARRMEVEVGSTRSGAVVGTPGYIAPEQALGRSGLVASDVYGLGAILYELLAGRPPFRAATPMETVLQAIEREPARPRALVSNIPLDLETICLKCLQKEPEKRYESAGAMADDLERYLAGESILARRPSIHERVGRWARRHPIAAWTGMVFVLLAAIGAMSASVLVQRERTRGAELRERAAANARAILERQHYFQTIALAERERAAHNAGRAEQLLDRCPEGLRGWEWYYLKRQRYEAAPLFRHPAHLFSLAISNNGGHLLAGGLDGGLNRWDTATGRGFRLADKHNKQVRGVAFSHDGEHCASASWDGYVRVWETQTGRMLWEWQAKQAGQQAFAVAFHPLGRILAASIDNEIVRWDLTTGKPFDSLLGHDNTIRALVFRPNGRDLASVDDDGLLKVWDANSGAPRRTIRAHPHLLFDVSYSSDGDSIVTAGGWFYMHGDGGEAAIWNADDGHELRRVRSASSAIYSAALSPDSSRLATAGEDRVVRIWDVASGQEALSLRGHAEAIWGLRFSPDGHRLYSASGDRTIRTWDASPMTDTSGPERLALHGHDDKVTCVALSPDRRLLVSAGMDGKALVRDATSGSLIRTLSLRGHVHSIVFHPNGGQLAVGLWRNYKDDQADPRVTVWDTRTWERATGPNLDTVGVLQVAYSRDGTLLGAAADHHVYVIDAATGREVWSAPHDSLVTSAAFGDGVFAVADADGVISLHPLQSSKPVRSIRAHEGRVMALSFDFLGKRLASAGADGKVRVWDPMSEKLLLALPGHAGGAFAVAFTSAGHLVTGGNDAMVREWDGQTGNERRIFGGHKDAVTALVLAPDGTIVTGSRDRTVRVWKPDQLAETFHLPRGTEKRNP